ncbi:MAG: DUF4252 domain-containing protein [Candidatus Kapabacteria bacterium]|jgi:hypothetical protein|nr:DUF4252 domain-containing protein [Candidatus Kapabacteria bacterium]
MKQFLTIALLFSVIFTSASFAGESKLNKLIAEYKGQTGFTSVVINETMFKLFADIGEDSDDVKVKGKMNDVDISSALEGIESVIIFSAEEGANAKLRKEFRDKLFKIVESDKQYTDLINVDEGDGSKVWIQIKKKGKIVHEFVLIRTEETETSLILLTGNINLSEIKNISKIVAPKSKKVKNSIETIPIKGQ